MIITNFNRAGINKEVDLNLAGEYWNGGRGAIKPFLTKFCANFWFQIVWFSQTCFLRKRKHFAIRKASRVIDKRRKSMFK